MGGAMTNQPSVASNPFLANAGGGVPTSTAMPHANGMFTGGQFPTQPATSVSLYGGQPATSAAFPNQMPAGKQMNGGVGTGFGGGGQMPQQFGTPQGQFAAQGQAQFPAAQGQFPTQQGQLPNQMGGQFSMQQQGQFPTQGAAVGMPPTSQMGGFGVQQQQPQNLSFGGAGMSAMAGMQFQKMGQVQQPGVQPGAPQEQLGGFGVGAQTGQQQQQATFSASWGTQQPAAAMTSNPFMASTTMCSTGAVPL